MHARPARLSGRCLDLWLVVLAASAGLAWTPPAAAAAPHQRSTATIHGTAREASGRPLALAVVDVTRLDTGQLRSTHTASDGSFLVVSLPPGHYRVIVTLAGFAPATEVFDLLLDQILDVPVTLTPTARRETVDVVADLHPLVEFGQTSLGRTITTRELDGLPISTGQFRDFTGLATLAPGVAPDATVAGGGITTAAQAGSSNQFLVDGLVGLPANLPIEAIQEFRIVSNGFAAEFGQASGAVIDVVTRSGSNTPAGRLSWFQQAGALDAASPLARLNGIPDPGFTQTDISGFWGGPLVPNRAFLLVSAREDIRHGQFINASASLARTFRPDDPLTTPVDWNLPQTFVRADVHLTPANTLTVDHNYSLIVGDDAAREPLSTNERRRSLNNPAQSLAVLDSHVFGASVVNEVRLQGTTSRFTQNINPFCPACVTLNYPDILLGAPAQGSQDNRTTTLEAADVVTWVTDGRAGAQAIKFGLDVAADRNANITMNTVGTYRFANDLPFDPTNPGSYPAQFTVNINGSYHSEREVIVSGFAQDEWRPSARITATAGVRWDRTTWPGPLSTAENDLAPRLGISVMPRTDGQTSIRAGLGRYYDERMLQLAYDADTGQQLSIANPGFQGSLTRFDPYGTNPIRGGQPAIPVISLFTFAPTSTPYIDEASVGVQHQFGRSVGLTADVVRALGHRLPIRMDLNYPTGPSGRRPDATVNQIIASETIAQSWYTGLQVGVTTRSLRGGVYAASYTWSSSENDTDGSRSFPSSGPNILVDRGPTLNDAPQRLTASGLVPIARGWSIQGVVNTWSGLPYNVTTGGDPNGDGVANDRPSGVGRDSARGAAFFQVDARLSKTVHAGAHALECLVEVFNLTNHANWTQYNGKITDRNGGFGKPGSAGPPREIQFGARWSF